MQPEAAGRMKQSEARQLVNSPAIEDVYDLCRAARTVEYLQGLVPYSIMQPMYNRTG